MLVSALFRAIIFMGPDGSGKSTQARNIARMLTNRGFKVRFCWIRGPHSIASILSRFLIKLGYFRLIETSESSYKVFDPKLLTGLGALWGFIEFLSVLPWIITRMYLPLLLGRIVVADRYILDTIVYALYYVGPGFMNVWGKILLCMVPKDSFLICMDADTHVLLERRRNEPLTMDYLIFQRKAYKKLTKQIGAVTMDTTNNNPAETFQAIKIFVHANLT